MDHNRFISVIKQFPQVWDRNSATFREQHLKSEAWDRIAEIMNYPVSICKDAFKSLREKYVREREKQIMFAEKYIPWQHLEGLSFLDPHIILRKQSLNYETDNRRLSEQKTAPVAAPQAPPEEDSRYLAQFAENYSDFDKTLISLVRKSSPIWDRKSNGYPSKQVKYQLWKNISQTMNKDVNICMMRWKGLREKYIRQRNKFQEGDRKWEFLDDMSFLDRVIQYRRKNGESSEYIKHLPESSFQFGNSNNFDDSSSINDSLSNDFIPVVKHEDFGDIQDSSYDSGTSSSRKRSASDNISEASSIEKRERIIEDMVQKSPEQMFGELVAAMLGKKTERDKNIAMIEIMQILTK